MTHRFFSIARVALFAIILTVACVSELRAQATIDFQRIVLRWPEIDLHFIARCDTGVVHPANVSDVHVLDEGVPCTVTALLAAGDETVATISGSCPSGMPHRVLLAVTLPCGTTGAVSQWYTAPYDPLAFRILRIGPYGMELPAGRTTQVPFYLLDPVGGTHSQRYRISFSIDSSVARPVGVSAPLGTILEGTDVTYTPWPLRAVEFTLPPAGRENDTGVLFYMAFEVPFRSDSVGILLDLWGGVADEDAVNCTRVQYFDAGFLAVPPAPRLQCESGAGADTLRWDMASGKYLPDPYIFKPVLRNVGSDDARTPVFILQRNPADLVLRSGYRDTLMGHPTRVPPGEICDAEWRFDVPEKIVRSHVTRVSAAVEYPGGATVVCSRDVVLLRDSFAVLNCTADAAPVAWNDATNRYVPMPIPLTVDVWNSGERASDTVLVEALLPDGLSFERGETAVKKLTPAVLAAHAGGSAEWMLIHGRTDVEKVYEVTVRCTAAGSSATECRTTVTIPVAPPLPFTTTLSASGPLSFCAGDSVMLDGGRSFTSWLWSTGDTTQLLRVTASGRYWCEVRDGNGRQGMSDTLQVTVAPLPPVPGIVRDGDILRSTGAAGLRHQWYRADWPLAGETTDTLRLPDTGLYTVHVYTAADCESISAPLDVRVLAVHPAITDDGYMLQAWPEPAVDAVSIELRVPAGRPVTLLLVDLLGRSELLFEGIPADGHLRLPLDLHARAAGSLLLQMRSGEILRIRRITRL
jgi:hypothetical protein